MDPGETAQERAKQEAVTTNTVSMNLKCMKRDVQEASMLEAAMGQQDFYFELEGMFVPEDKEHGLNSAIPKEIRSVDQHNGDDSEIKSLLLLLLNLSWRSTRAIVMRSPNSSGPRAMSQRALEKCFP